MLIARTVIKLSVLYTKSVDAPDYMLNVMTIINFCAGSTRITKLCVIVTRMISRFQVFSVQHYVSSITCTVPVIRRGSHFVRTRVKAYQV